ncbi:MAG TPA: homocysteine S-methyltransferase family protein [Solirubrobacteraceae bacterium]|nr:homocysteine S-methyltransferase family protein [Solirubrobacteraceae bacterium]
MSVLEEGARVQAAYRRVEELIAAERCVILDGGIATELGRRLPDAERGRDEALWGTWALVHSPDVVRDVHRTYVDIGCDVISTNTWGLTSEMQNGRTGHLTPLHWMDVARRGIEVGREAIAQAGRTDEVALAFSVNGDVDGPARREFIELLPRAFEDNPPDLILLETITLIRNGLTVGAIEALVATGLPVWTSFRRCRHGVCGVFGQHWGGPEGDEFGRAARRLDDLGVRALLINCLPPDHVPGMLPWLRDFTDMPLGVYPNLGYYTDDGWSFDKTVDGDAYGELATTWRREGAQIIGGCCGTRPEHVAGARARVREMPRGSRGAAEPAANGALREGGPAEKAARPWTDDRDRRLYPLPVPELVCEPGVFVPTHGSFLVWKHLFQHGIGAGKRCLDIGCGTGMLAIELARNGAEHVHAIDVDRRAVANTLSNAFRNGVADRITGETIDLYPWVPRDRYDIVVASLYQMPVDPYEQPNSHRPLDFWGRNLLDHLFTLLPKLLADDGVAYVMQLSILGQERTAELLAEGGFETKIADFEFFAFHDLFAQRKDQIDRVEELSDAYHLTFRDEDMMVAYLLEITHA